VQFSGNISDMCVRCRVNTAKQTPAIVGGSRRVSALRSAPHARSVRGASVCVRPAHLHPTSTAVPEPNHTAFSATDSNVSEERQPRLLHRPAGDCRLNQNRQFHTPRSVLYSRCVQLTSCASTYSHLSVSPSL